MRINGPVPNHILKLMDPKERKSMGKSGATSEELQEKNVAKSEKELQNQIAAMLTRNGIWFDRDAMHKRRTGTKSAPDFLMAIGGRALALECKMPGNNPDPGQEKAIAQMRFNGWQVEVVRSYDEARAAVNKFGGIKL